MADASDNKDQNQNQTAPDDTNKAYGQYIDPDYHNKQKKKKLLIIIASILAALAVIIVVAVIVASLSSSPEPSSAGNSSGANGDDAAAGNLCEDEECFNENFASCQPAIYEGQGFEENSTIEYKISGVQDVGCLVTLQYVNSPEEEVTGKEMTCDFDNELEFREALALVDEYPDDYECEGSLVDFYNGLEEEVRAIYDI